MTKAEQIKQLETVLKLERMEHEKTRSRLREYQKHDECYVVAQQEGAAFDNLGGYSRHVIVRVFPAPFGAGNFDLKAFDGALGQFIRKWNELAVEACEKNEYRKGK